jgi:hypothetical protein
VKKIRITLIAILLLTAMLAVFSPVQAANGSQWLSFTTCTVNNATNAATGSAQLFVEVVPVGINQVTFHFINIGPNASSITDVYFDDGNPPVNLLSLASITDSGAGVSFSQFATPRNLPSGNACNPKFIVTKDFSADSNSPVQPMGVNPQEWLDITFTLQPNTSVGDVVTHLVAGSLRVGIHVQGFANGGSEAFINSPFTAVTLSSFQATPGRGQVSLAWTTGAEMQNAGFNLYRSTSLTGQRVKVNAALLAAKGNEVSGASYGHMDVPGNGTFYYWLEDVDYTGHSTLHGPVVAAVRPSLQRPAYRPTLPTVTR